MTIVYGLTPQGFVSKSGLQVQAEVEAALLNGPLGQGAAVNGKIPSGTAAGQLVALISDAPSFLWELALIVYTSFDPSQNVDASQDAICSITGVIREGPTHSEVSAYCTGTPDTLLVAGRVAQVGTTGPQFASLDDRTIAAAVAWAALGTYVAGDVRTSNVAGVGPVFVYYCKASVSGSSTEPGFDPTHWTLLGRGTGAVVVPFHAQDFGPLAAPAGTLTDIVTPVLGWNDCHNVADADLGTTLETNAHLRIRREQELHSTGNATVDAIRTKVLNVVNNGIVVSSCSVFYNDTDAVSDGSTPPNMPAGMPAHSVFVLADYAGSDSGGIAAMNDAIGLAVWNALGAGIATSYGLLSGDNAIDTTLTDSQGNTVHVFWGIPVRKQIYVSAAVTFNNTLAGEPSAGDIEVMIAGGTLSSNQDIAGALPVFGSTYTVGKNVWTSAVIAAIFGSPIDTAASAQPAPGILAAWPVYIGLTPSPGSAAMIAIAQTEIAVFTSANMAITATGSAP